MSRVECISTCGCELEHYRKRRVWFYNDWDPERWWQRLAFLGGDEFDRRTIVLFSRMVVALWPFKDWDLDD